MYKNKIAIYIGLLLAMTFVLLSCSSEYDQYVKRELDTGVRNDSLILGMHMGQTKKAFFTHCWKLNNEKIISQGTGNKTVRYTEKLDSTADQNLRKDLLFYGIFSEDNIMIGMDMTYAHTAWSPWNKDLHSDQLAIRLKEKFVSDYGGNAFITIQLEDGTTEAYVKIDGNRQILIYPKNNKDVAVKIEDINYKYKTQ